MQKSKITLPTETQPKRSRSHILLIISFMFFLPLEVVGRGER